jgi:hypothetical protein
LGRFDGYHRGMAALRLNDATAEAHLSIAEAGRGDRA